ncbi:MAG: cyclophilin-like fold protein [candidate division WOR-3 bacterium]
METKRIKITSESIGEVYATLTDENPNTVRAFCLSLPIEGRANLWGEEIYFRIPVPVTKENGREVVEKGEIGIWVESPSFCIFFGKTPVSGENEIRAYSEVNIIGKIEGDPEVFKAVRQGEIIRVVKAK